MVKIKEMGKEMEAVKTQYEKVGADYERQFQEWQAMEKDYKTELKKLEVLLAKAENGLDSVMLARSQSKVYNAKGAPKPKIPKLGEDADPFEGKGRTHLVF